jgi:hypothetical protein
VTQASLSPDLESTMGMKPPNDAGAHASQSPESALWLFGLMSLATMLAAALILALLAQSAPADASLGGLLAGVAVMIAGLGAGALAYVYISARRAGYLGGTRQKDDARSPVAPSGMSVVPAVPADLGRRKKQQARSEQAERNHQAKAIATVAASAHRVRAPAPAPAPVRTQVAARPVAPPLVRMPRPAVAPTRPALSTAVVPAFPRMSPALIHPRSSPALFQVGAASVRVPFAPPRGPAYRAGRMAPYVSPSR